MGMTFHRPRQWGVVPWALPRELFDRQGFDLCEPVLPGVLGRHDVQLVVLGTGETCYEHLCRLWVWPGCPTGVGHGTELGRAGAAPGDGWGAIPQSLRRRRS